MSESSAKRPRQVKALAKQKRQDSEQEGDPLHEVHHDAWVGAALLLFIAIALFIVLIVLYTGPTATIAVSPKVTLSQIQWERNRPSLPRHAAQRDTVRLTPGQCTVGEEFDTRVGLCVPVVNTPLALEDAIIDRGVIGCDDFYSMTCGNWLTTHQDESRSFSALYHQNQWEVADIIRNETSGPIHDFYQSCLKELVDKSTQHQQKEEAEQMLASMLSGIYKHEGLPVLFARLLRHGLPAPFAVTIENHPTKALMIPTIHRDGFLFDETTDYIELVDIFSLLNPTEIAHIKAAQIVGIVNKLDAQAVPDTRRFDSYVDYLKDRNGFRRDLFKWGALGELFQAKEKSFSLLSFIMLLGGPSFIIRDTQDIWVLDKGHFLNLDVSVLSMAEWRVYTEFSVLYSIRDFFPDLEDDAYFTEPLVPGASRRWTRIERRRRFGEPLDYRMQEQRSVPFPVPRRIPTPKLPSRKRTTPLPAVTQGDCVHITHKMLPGLISHRFMNRSGLGEGDVERVKRMVEAIRDEFAALIDQTEWMDQHTRDTAKQKLRAINVRVAHPNTWPVESFAGRILPMRYAHNLNLVRAYRVQRDLDLWRNSGGWFDLDEIARFGAPLSTVNAYYSPSTNSIVIFAGIMRPPFYHTDYDVLSLYATLGVVVGHELSHSMDPMGSQFDQWGSFRAWWTQESRTEQQTRLQCIAHEYAPPDYCVIEGDDALDNYGNRTLGEDTADLIGVLLAFRAWKKADAALPHEAKATDRARGVTPSHEEQYWFMIYSQLWCASYSHETACERILTDPHPLPRMRVTETLRNLPVFARVFGCNAPWSSMVHDPPCHLYGPEN